MRAGCDLCKRIGFNAAVIALAHFLGENLASGRVDALTDDDERPIETDPDFLAGRTDQGLCHSCILQCWRSSAGYPHIVFRLQSSQSCPAAMAHGRQHARALDDLADAVLLAKRHDVNAVHAVDFPQFADHVDADLTPSSF